MHRQFMGGRVVAICAALLLAALAVSPVLIHKTHAANPLNLVYVTSNVGAVPNMNSVYAWTNDGSGNLTPVNGSPYLTGGTGFYDPGYGSFSDEADNELVISSATNRLFTVNANSNTIAVMNVNTDGSLTPVVGSPFASGGQEPLSLAISPGVLRGGLSLLTVDNMADDPNQVDGAANLNTFVIKSTGVLGTISNSTVSLGVGANPTQVEAIAGSGQNFVTAVQRGSASVPPTVYMFHVAGGVLKQVHSLKVGVGGALIGIAVDPISPTMYVGYPSANEFNVIQYGPTNGTLTALTRIPSDGNATCWMAVNSAGTRLYTVNFLSGTVNVYDITTADSPAQLQSFLLSGTTPMPTNVAFDPTGQFFYVLTQQSLHVLNVSQTDGTLSETVSPVTIPVPAAEVPIGVATLSR
jgi:6-phosphogluconolactonase (cycloisomerase 2 family)